MMDVIDTEYTNITAKVKGGMMLDYGPELEDGDDFEMSLQLTSYNMFKKNNEWVFEKRHN